MSAIRVASLALATVAALAAPALATHGFRVATTDQARQLRVAEAPVALEPLALRDHRGTAVPLADRNRITIADLIYTRCPTLCVQLSASFQGMQHAIEERGLQHRVRLLTITFDLVADSLPALADFAERHQVKPELWDVARPEDPAALRSLQQALGIKVLADGAGGFVHNAALHLIDTEGRLVAILPADAPLAALDAALARSKRLAQGNGAATP